jgi:NCAIR mutase (PurE)-related protein
VEQLLVIAEQVRARGRGRCSRGCAPTRSEPLLDALPEAVAEADARIVAFPGIPPEPTGHLVVVLAAGTSDVPVAREAAVTARHLGRPVELGRRRRRRRAAPRARAARPARSARAIVVAAGMDGALPGVVAGLVAAPVIAVPTVGRVRRRVRRPRPAADHAQRVRSGRRRRQHRQRLRRRHLAAQIAMS